MGCFLSNQMTNQGVNSGLTKKPMDADIIVLKAKKQRDQLVLQKKGIERSAEEALQKAKQAKQQNSKDMALYFLNKKKILSNNLKGIYLKLDLLEKQINNLESAQDSLEFTKIVKANNDLLSELKDQINTEEIIRARELNDEINLQNEEIQNLLQEVELDEEIMNDYDLLGGANDIENIKYEQGFKQDQLKQQHSGVKEVLLN